MSEYDTANEHELCFQIGKIKRRIAELEDEAPRFLCPVQRAIDKASISNGKISPWTMHVAGIQDGGMCKVKEVMKWL